MTTWELFKSAWDWEPSVLAGTVLLLSGYLAAVRCRINRRTLYFVSGVVVMVLALVSPLDTLGDDYLFSAHMLQHILLDMVAPPLFVLGLPVELVRRLLRWRPAAMLERMLGRPAVAWILGIGTLWLWHLPYLYDLTLENENIHIAEHLSFLVTGTIFWWPAFSPLSERRLPALTSVVYLTCGALASGLLGIIFTLSSTPFYSGYLHPKDELGALSLIRNQWGLDPVTDQQLGGAFMWVIGSFIFLWAIVAQVVHWYGESETEADTASTAAGLKTALSGSIENLPDARIKPADKQCEA